MSMWRLRNSEHAHYCFPYSEDNNVFMLHALGTERQSWTRARTCMTVCVWVCDVRPACMCCSLYVWYPIADISNSHHSSWVVGTFWTCVWHILSFGHFNLWCIIHNDSTWIVSESTQQWTINCKAEFATTLTIFLSELIKQIWWRTVFGYFVIKYTQTIYIEDGWGIIACENLAWTGA